MSLYAWIFVSAEDRTQTVDDSSSPSGASQRGLDKIYFYGEKISCMTYLDEVSLSFTLPFRTSPPFTRSNDLKKILKVDDGTEDYPWVIVGP